MKLHILQKRKERMSEGEVRTDHREDQHKDKARDLDKDKARDLDRDKARDLDRVRVRDPDRDKARDLYRGRVRDLYRGRVRDLYRGRVRDLYKDKVRDPVRDQGLYRIFQRHPNRGDRSDHRNAALSRVIRAAARRPDGNPKTLWMMRKRNLNFCVGMRMKNRLNAIE